MAFTKEDAARYLVGKGLSPVAAAGLVGNMGAESGYDPGIEERGRMAQKGFGLMQWTGPRRDALVQFAADTGGNAADPYTQMDFLLKELRGPEQRAAAMLANAQTPEEANAGALAFLRPSGWTLNGDVTKASQYGTRLANTQALMGVTTPAPATPPMQPYTPAAPPTAYADAGAQAAPGLMPKEPEKDSYGDLLSGVMKAFAPLTNGRDVQPAAPEAPMQPLLPMTPMRRAPAAAPMPVQVQQAAAPKLTGDDLIRRMGGLWAWKT